MRVWQKRRAMPTYLPFRISAGRECRGRTRAARDSPGAESTPPAPQKISQQQNLQCAINSMKFENTWFYCFLLTGASWLTTKRPVLQADRVTASLSQGCRVLKSISSQEIPWAAAISHAYNKICVTSQASTVSSSSHPCTAPTHLPQHKHLPPPPNDCHVGPNPLHLGHAQRNWIVSGWNLPADINIE